MTKEQFIKEIAKYVKIYAPKYGISICSPIIAQACLESGYGTSNKAKYHNYFGLKYKAGRVSCHKGYFTDGGSEQNKDGSYTPISTSWYSFADMEHGVEGYFQFINTTRYANLKGVTDPKKYLENIKADGYATSLSYVDNVYKVIQNWDLTKYDVPVAVTPAPTPAPKPKYTNSPLATYTRISPNRTSPRNHEIDTITIHCFVGQVTVERGCEVFADPNRKASCNYVIAKDGKIGLVCEEKDRSWCSGGTDSKGKIIYVNGISGAMNDHRAITIEVASDTVAPYKVTDAAYKSLIELVADICSRNNIRELKWQGNKNLVGKIDQQNMTVHRWFANKACPGDYLYNKHGEIASMVNRRLDMMTPIGPITPTPNPQPTPQPESTDYKVRVTASALNIRKGPGTNYAIVGVIRDKGIYTIVAEENGFGKLKSGAGWIALQYTTKI